MLVPKNVQCRILAALLGGGLPEGFSVAEIDGLFFAFEERWQRCLELLLFAVENEPEGLKRTSFINSVVQMPSAEREEIGREAERVTRVPSLAELEVPAIEWVWEGWIPKGMLTVFGAMPSAGKSYVALDIAGRVMTGTSFPDGSAVGQQGPVIYVDAENVPQMHSQRAQGWGMDGSQLYLMGPAEGRLMVDLSEEFDRDRLVEWAWYKRPALVVDSLSAVSSKGENNVEDVRNVFSFLSRLALDYECGMVVIHHLRKPGAQLPLPKFLACNGLRGSWRITAMSRSIIGLHWVQTGPR
jgi:predicted ATP-dependent serine protease